MNRYEEFLNRELDKIQGFRHDDRKNLEKYPAETVKAVLNILLEWACQAQNFANIELGRKGISEISSRLLKTYLLECAESCLDLSDEWEYRRFLEVVELASPDLMEAALALGEKSENAEVRETAAEFRDL